MKFFIVASLLALAAAEPVMDTPSVQAAKVAHHAAVVHDTAVHMQAKANAAMYKAHVPHVYTHQAPYVYNYNPVVYTQPKVADPRLPVVYTQPKVADPRVYVAAPVTYTAPVAYTTHHQSMVYNHAYPYAPQYHTLHKREAEAEAEADPQVFYNTYGYYPQGYTAPVTYTHQVAPVVYTKPEVEVKKVEQQPAVTYAYPNYPVYRTPVTYTKTVNPVVYKAPVPVTYTHHQVATPVTYTTTPYTHQSMVYNHAYPYAPQFNTLFKREIEAEPY